MSNLPPRSYDVELDDQGECAGLMWTCPECGAENSERYRQLFPEEYPLRCAPGAGRICGYTYRIPTELFQDIRRKCERAKTARAAG